MLVAKTPSVSQSPVRTRSLKYLRAPMWSLQGVAEPFAATAAKIYSKVHGLSCCASAMADADVTTANLNVCGRLEPKGCATGEQLSDLTQERRRGSTANSHDCI